MNSHDRLFRDCLERAITSIESWMAPSMGDDGITLDESIQVWLRGTAAGPRVRCAVVKHYRSLGYEVC